jgi:glycosyltransferase involved in cell wall biosynthesis
VDLCVSDFLFAVPNVPLKDEQEAALKLGATRNRTTLGATNTRVPVVLFEHNVEYLIWQRLASLESRPVRKTLFELEWRKLRLREGEACAQADLTIAVSDEDKKRLAQLAPNARFATIPTGVDTSYFKPNGRREIPARLVFTGSMDWHPNEDAVIYFSEAILPRIRTYVPEISLTVVGRNPSARLREVADRAGIMVTGTVDDVRPYIDEAALYVVPLRAGSGTRLKIFEALAMGKAVVSTTVGAEGLSVTPGRDVVLADEPDDFAASVISLLHEPAERRMLGEAGRTLVETHYSWAQVTSDFETCCKSVVADYEHTRNTAERRAHLSRTGPTRHRGPGLVAGKHDELGWHRPHS